MKPEVLAAIAALEQAALTLEVAMDVADRLRTRGGLTFQERVALNRAGALGRKVALR